MFHINVNNLRKVLTGSDMAHYDSRDLRFAVAHEGGYDCFYVEHLLDDTVSDYSIYAALAGELAGFCSGKVYYPPLPDTVDDPLGREGIHYLLGKNIDVSGNRESDALITLVTLERTQIYSGDDTAPVTDALISLFSEEFRSSFAVVYRDIPFLSVKYSCATDSCFLGFVSLTPDRVDGDILIF